MVFWYLNSVLPRSQYSTLSERLSLYKANQALIYYCTIHSLTVGSLSIH
jgi:hypothetical protein